MNRVRLVKTSFEANKHEKIPPESTRFQEGDKLIFLRQENGQTVFRHGSYRKFPDLYMASDGVFEASTEEI